MGDDKNKRIDFVDLTKGVCIILVVMAHIGGAFEKLDYHSMIASFRMPLYFFISGIFFKSYEGLFGFFIRKINKLIVPFLFFYLSAFLLKYIVWKIAPGVFQLPVSWTELLVVFHDHALIKFNPPIWFLLALFNCNILFYLVHSLRDRKLGLMFALTLLIGIAGFYMGKHQIELPLYIDIAMTALPFYVAGFWIRRYNFFLFPHRFDKLIPLCILAALVVMYFTATFVGLEELSAQYDNDNQVYKGRYSRCQIGDFPNIRTRNIVSHRSQKHYKEPGNGVDYLKYVNQGPLELFIRAAQMAQQHFEISPPSGSSRKSKEENGHRDDDSSNRPKHCFESRQGQWSTIQAGIPQAGNDDNQGGNRADTHRTDKNLKCPPQSLLHRMLRFGGGVNHRRGTPASLTGEHGAG